MSSVIQSSAGVADVARPFASVLQRVEEWHESLSALLVSSGGTPKVAQLDALIESLVVPDLSERDTFIVGAGFVCAPGFLPGAPWHLSWWLGKFNSFGAIGRGGVTRRLEASEDPGSDSFRDYTLLEWWRVPARSGLPHITGPYVDYLCTDEYTLTLTVPVYFAGELIGVIGADMYAEDVERMLLPTLRAIDGGATLVNRVARVVVSADPRRATGSLYRAEGLLDSLNSLGTLAVRNIAPVLWGGTSLALLVDFAVA